MGASDNKGPKYLFIIKSGSELNSYSHLYQSSLLPQQADLSLSNEVLACCQNTRRSQDEQAESTPRSIQLLGYLASVLLHLHRGSRGYCPRHPGYPQPSEMSS